MISAVLLPMLMVLVVYSNCDQSSDLWQQVDFWTSIWPTRNCRLNKNGPWETPMLTEYSWEYFPSGTIRKRLLQRKDEISLKANRKFHKTWVYEVEHCQILPKDLAISSATARALAKVLEILSNTT